MYLEACLRLSSSGEMSSVWQFNIQKFLVNVVCQMQTQTLGVERPFGNLFQGGIVGSGYLWMFSMQAVERKRVCNLTGWIRVARSVLNDVFSPTCWFGSRWSRRWRCMILYDVCFLFWAAPSTTSYTIQVWYSFMTYFPARTADLYGKFSSVCKCMVAMDTTSIGCTICIYMYLYTSFEHRDSCWHQKDTIPSAGVKDNPTAGSDDTSNWTAEGR